MEPPLHVSGLWATVLNISEGGICLKVAEVQPGEVYRADPDGRAQLSPRISRRSSLEPGQPGGAALAGPEPGRGDLAPEPLRDLAAGGKGEAEAEPAPVMTPVMTDEQRLFSRQTATW